MPKKEYLLESSVAKEKGLKGFSYKTFDQKTEQERSIINQALEVLESLGIPVIEKTPRARECMALCFLAVADVKQPTEWKTSKSLQDDHALTTREVINFINSNFTENISSGSYDDIRRKHLLHPFLGGVVYHDKPDSNQNNPTRKWGVTPEASKALKAYQTNRWEQEVTDFKENTKLLIEKLSEEREIQKVPVIIPDGTELTLDGGEHNLIQKAIVEEFLPRFGHGAELIYLGDASNKSLFHNKDAEKRLGLEELSHKELPDVVAYSEEKNWLYLIEAVHSANPINKERILRLESYFKKSSASVLYVTAFLDRKSFARFVGEIAWETEVWLASSPDHLIHFNGDKFLGPYNVS